MQAITINQFAGFQLVAQPFMADQKQVKFPRSKKKRIQKKWAKRPEPVGCKRHNG